MIPPVKNWLISYYNRGNVLIGSVIVQAPTKLLAKLNCPAYPFATPWTYRTVRRATPADVRAQLIDAISRTHSAKVELDAAIERATANLPEKRAHAAARDEVIRLHQIHQSCIK